MGVARSTFEFTRIVIFSLFVLVGSGLMVNGSALMLAAAGLALAPIVFALLAGRRSATSTGLPR